MFSPRLSTASTGLRLSWDHFLFLVITATLDLELIVVIIKHVTLDIELIFLSFANVKHSFKAISNFDHFQTFIEVAILIPYTCHGIFGEINFNQFVQKRYLYNYSSWSIFFSFVLIFCNFGNTMVFYFYIMELSESFVAFPWAHVKCR